MHRSTALKVSCHTRRQAPPWKGSLSAGHLCDRGPGCTGRGTGHPGAKRRGLACIGQIVHNEGRVCHAGFEWQLLRCFLEGWSAGPGTGWPGKDHDCVA